MKQTWLLQFAVVVIIMFAQTSITPAGEEPEFIITEGWELDRCELYDLEYVIFGVPCPSIWPPTRADMTGGSVGNCEENSGMFTYESSTFNVYGGIVYYLHAYNSSVVNISGGTVSDWSCGGIETTITANDYSTINLYDGAFLWGGSWRNFELCDSSKLNVYGGDVNLYLVAFNSSIVNIYGGRCWLGIYPYDYSMVNVYGGFIDVFLYNVPVPPVTATVNIYGYGFNYNPQAYWEDASGCWITALTGYGADGTGIEYRGLPEPATHSNINLIPDFVMDRGVDIADFAAFAPAWRSQDGDANWNRNYDISEPNDNVIDERDLAVLTRYWLAGVE